MLNIFTLNIISCISHQVCENDYFLEILKNTNHNQKSKYKNLIFWIVLLYNLPSIWN